VPPLAVDFVLFDLGGVLIELGGMAEFQALTGLSSEEAMWDRWLTCPWVRRFEAGRCTSAEFSEGVVDTWGLPMSPEQFMQIFEAWPIGPFAGSERLLADVRAVVPIGCCSNTNVVHWTYQEREWPLLQMFDHTFLSFELGLVKPDRELFEAVAGRVSADRDRVLFLDDVARNVDAARSFGFRAEQAYGPAECRSIFADIGLLAD
jgi:glucose-1-phosphatase